MQLHIWKIHELNNTLINTDLGKYTERNVHVEQIKFRYTHEGN